MEIPHNFIKLVKFLFTFKEHEKIFYALESKKYNHKLALSYLKGHKVLSNLCDICLTTKRLGLEPHIYMNGLEYSIKNIKPPKLQKDLDFSNALRTDLSILNEESEIVEEVDYIDPKSHKIINNLLIEDKVRADREKRKLLQEKEQNQQNASLSNDLRTSLGRQKLQRQVLTLKRYERNELLFRSELKKNLNQVFSNLVPKSKETKQYLIVDGQGLVKTTQKLLSNKDNYRGNPENLITPGKGIEVTTSPNLERSHHLHIHQYMRNIKTQQSQRVRYAANGLAHVNSMISLTSFEINDQQESERQTYTQRLIDSQNQRRILVKVDKPEPKPKNVVLQMLQDRYPELQTIFKDPFSRQAHRRNVFRQRRGSVQISAAAVQQHQSQSKLKTASRNSLNFSTVEDDAKLVCTEDQVTALDTGTQGTFEMMDDGELASAYSPIIKIKPVYPRGKLYK